MGLDHGMKDDIPDPLSHSLSCFSINGKGFAQLIHPFFSGSFAVFLSASFMNPPLHLVTPVLCWTR